MATVCLACALILLWFMVMLNENYGHLGDCSSGDMESVEWRDQESEEIKRKKCISRQLLIIKVHD